MSNTFTTANMNLTVPNVGVDPGPDYATNINASLGKIDSHNHSVGQGVQITPTGININTDLPFNDNSATELFTLVLNSQSSALSGTNFISCINGNMYFNDGAGNQVQITSGGGVAGSPGSIGGLVSPAAATYTPGSTTFSWTAASNKAAAMDNGAVTIRQTNTTSAHGITLSSPNALAADYGLTFPAALPISSQYIQCSSTGILSFPSPNIVTSSSCVVFTTNSSSFVAITNLSVTLTTSGRPVMLICMADNFGVSSFLGANTAPSNTPGAQYAWKRGASQLCNYTITSAFDGSSTSPEIIIPPGSINMIDTPTAGTYTYTLNAANSSTGGGQAIAQHCIITAYEI